MQETKRKPSSIEGCCMPRGKVARAHMRRVLVGGERGIENPAGA